MRVTFLRQLKAFLWPREHSIWCLGDERHSGPINPRKRERFLQMDSRSARFASAFSEWVGFMVVGSARARGSLAAQSGRFLWHKGAKRRATSLISTLAAHMHNIKLGWARFVGFQFAFEASHPATQTPLAQWFLKRESIIGAWVHIGNNMHCGKNGVSD